MKKRKTFGSLLALLMTLMLVIGVMQPSTSIAAEDSTASVTDYSVSEVTLDGSNQTEVRASKGSRFFVTIPKLIVLGASKNATYHVNVCGDISGREAINVIPENSFSMAESGNKACKTATVSQEKITWTYADLWANGGNGTTSDGFVEAPLSAGTWKGHFWFNIEKVDNKDGREETADEVAGIVSIMEKLRNNIVLPTIYTEEEARSFVENAFEEAIKPYEGYRVEISTIEWAAPNDGVSEATYGQYSHSVELFKDDKCVFSSEGEIFGIYLIHAHQWLNDNDVVLEEADCVKEGTVLHKCACGATYTETIPALGHDMCKTVISPSGNEEGYTLHKCSRCGYEYKDNFVRPQGEYIKLSWEQPLSEVGAFLGDQNYCTHSWNNGSYYSVSDRATTTSLCGCKRIVATDKNNNCTYINPYETDHAYIPKGAAITFEMFSFNSGSSSYASSVIVKGTAVSYSVYTHNWTGELLTGAVNTSASGYISGDVYITGSDVPVTENRWNGSEYVPTVVGYKWEITVDYE